MRGRAAGQPLNRVFEPSLSPGSHMLEHPSMLMASCSLLPPCCNAIAKSLPKSALGRLGGVGDGAPPGAGRAWMGLSGRFLALAICPWRAPHADIRGYGPRGHLEAGASQGHISLAPGKQESSRKVHPGAHGARRRTVTKPPKADLGRLLAGCHVAVSGKQSGPTGRSTPIHDAYAWARAMGVRQGSMRSDTRVSGEYATKGLVGERIVGQFSPHSTHRAQPHCAPGAPHSAAGRCHLAEVRSVRAHIKLLHV